MTKIALVTGTSSGIGLSAAALLAQSGFKVVATMRDLSKGASLQSRAVADGAFLDLRELDVQDEQSVKSCIDKVISQYGRIDVLVNNAGAGFLGAMEMTPTEDLKRTMDVNFFGVWRVVQAVFPAMRAAGSGRIISVSSVGGLIGQPFNDAYCAAKFAVEGFMESLAPVAKRLGIHLSIIEPGPVNTEFVSNVQRSFQEPPEHLREAYSVLIDSYVEATRTAFEAIGQTPDEIGNVIVKAATAEKPHFRYLTSDLARTLVSQKYVDTTGDSIVDISGARLPMV